LWGWNYGNWDCHYDVTKIWACWHIRKKPSFLLISI
jgi:hypothetical protein